MQIIIVTGTPGTGKTTYAKDLANFRNYCYLDVNHFIKKHKLYEGYDKKNSCYIVDTNKLCCSLKKHIVNFKNRHKKKLLPKRYADYAGIVIDSHLSHYLDPNIADLCVVMRCNPKKLGDRLRKRGYSDKKVQDNIVAEIMEVCLSDALQKGHNVRVMYS